MGDKRMKRDGARAAIVQQGIVKMETEGRSAAAKYLEAQAIPFRVIVRVLAEPGQRRKSD